MNNFRLAMMDGPEDSSYAERPLTREHRFLVVCLYLSYLVAIAGLALIGNIFAQPVGYAYFALLILPLVILCFCYVRLRHITGKIMALPERKLDERQRMVRDRVHHSAYKVITVLCLGILVYFAVHSVLLSALAPHTLAHPSSVVPNTLPVAKFFIVGQIGHDPVDVIWSTSKPLGDPHPVIIVAPQSSEWVVITQSAPSPTQVQVPAPPPSDLLSMGIYYALFLITMLLIIKTLPTAIVAWKERG